MGRGLSDLQGWMLIRALDRPDKPDEGDRGCELTIARVLCEFYHLEMNTTIWEGRRYLGVGKAFDPSESRLHRPAVVRAMNRLEERKLVNRVVGAWVRWSGFDLTPEGRNVAVMLEKTKPNLKNR